jgi:hypothetical protein
MRYTANGNTPSVEKIANVLGIPRQNARTLKDVLTGKVDLEDIEAGAERIGECYHKPSKIDVVMHIANKILGGYGVEYVAHKNDGYLERESKGFEYVNMGDTYEPTLIFDRLKGKWIVGTWGDIVERRPNLYV